MKLYSFPDAIAIDPRGCGCTECITGQYIPLEVFEAGATSLDLLAVALGDVANNTGTDLIREPAYTDSTAQWYQQRVLYRDQLRIPELTL